MSETIRGKNSSCFTAAAIVVGALLLSACSVSSPIQRFSESTSRFGTDPPLIKNNIPSSDIYRIFEQAATGYVPIDALREGTEQRAVEFCERQGKGMLLLGDQTSKPPYILGNFPRIEIVFACVDKPNAARGHSGADEQYAKLSNLKKLLDQGAITKSEFEKEKAKILSQY